jgi:hypothetical protein
MKFFMGKYHKVDLRSLDVHAGALAGVFFQLVERPEAGYNPDTYIFRHSWFYLLYVFEKKNAENWILISDFFFFKFLLKIS